MLSTQPLLMQEDIVLCKIYRKATSLKVLEQRAAMEGEMKISQEVSSSSLTMETIPHYMQHDNLEKPMLVNDIEFKTKVMEEEEYEQKKQGREKETQEASSSLLRCQPATDLPELQVPKISNDWTQDSFWTQLRSPWLDSWTSYINIMDF